MKKILIVKYTPRNERSRTKELLDYYISKKDENNEIEILDLEKNTPEFFLNENLGAYYKRNYAKIEISDSEKKSLEKFDTFTEQFINADEVVFAYPMYNFSMPAIVKAYFDMILQKGKTWDINDSGYAGLQEGKKIVLITTSGGDYKTEDGYNSWEHNIQLMHIFAGFIGAKLEVVDGGGMNENEETVMNNAKKIMNEVGK